LTSSAHLVVEESRWVVVIPAIAAFIPAVVTCFLIGEDEAHHGGGGKNNFVEHVFALESVLIKLLLRDWL